MRQAAESRLGIAVQPRTKDLDLERFAKPYRVVNPGLTDEDIAAIKTEALAHLLACLRTAVELLDENMNDVDARVVEAHVAALARGEEWYGDPIAPPPAIYAKP